MTDQQPTLNAQQMAEVQKHLVLATQRIADGMSLRKWAVDAALKSIATANDRGKLIDMATAIYDFITTEDN